MAKINSKEAKVVELFTGWVPILHTIASDNGKEFAHHKIIAKKLTIDYFFANPYVVGSVERTNC